MARRTATMQVRPTVSGEGKVKMDIVVVNRRDCWEWKRGGLC